MQLSRYSLEYVFVDVTGDGVAALTHELAIVPGVAAEVDWLTATWDATETAARILVQASSLADATGADITLAPGAYSVFWRASGTPEYPARHAGTLWVT